MRLMLLVLSVFAAVLALVVVLFFRQQAVDAREREEAERLRRFDEELRMIADGAKKIDDDFNAAMRRIDAEKRRALDRIDAISELNRAKSELAAQLERSARYAKDEADAEERLERARKLREEISASFD